MSLHRLRRLGECCGLLLATLLAGCPGDDGAASGSVAGALTVYVEAYCDALFHCAIADDDQMAQRFGLRDEATCRRVLTRYMQSDASDDVRRWRAMEAAGMLVVDGSNYEACRELGRSCNPFLSQCLDMLEGNVALGAACTRSEACAGDAYCVFDDEADGASEQCGYVGTCKARVAMGEPCGLSDECQTGVAGYRMCDHAGPENRCVDVKLEVARAGEPCGEAIQGDVRRLVTCEKGLWCDGATGEVGAGLPGACRSPLKLGAACDDHDDVCEGTAFCMSEGTESLCKKFTLLHAGEPCNVPGALALCDVFGGFTCGASNVCVALGDGSAGSRCDSTDFGELVPCQPGLRCFEESSSCERLYDLGEGCESDAECESDYCDPLRRKCEADRCEDGAPKQITSG